MLTLLFFAAPGIPSAFGAEAGAYWTEENLPGLVPDAVKVLNPALSLPLNGYVSVWSQDCSVADGAIGPRQASVTVADGAIGPRQASVTVADGAIETAGRGEGIGKANSVISTLPLPQPLPAVGGQASVTSEPCAIPLPLVKNRTISFELALPQAPGQAQTRTIKEIFSLDGAGELSLTLSFYAVCPYAAVKSSIADSAIETAGRGKGIGTEQQVERTQGKGRGVGFLTQPQPIPLPAVGVTGACPALYFQAQAELEGAAGAFCAAALNEKDFTPFPVLMCGGAKTRGTRFGITLHRAKL